MDRIEMFPNIQRNLKGILHKIKLWHITLVVRMLKLKMLKNHPDSTQTPSSKEQTMVQPLHRDQFKLHLYCVTTVVNKDIDQLNVGLGETTSCQMLFGCLNQ